MPSENLTNQFPGLAQLPKLEGIDIQLLVEHVRDILTDILENTDENEERDEDARSLIFGIDGLRLMNQDLFEKVDLQELRDIYKSAKPKDESFLFAIKAENENWDEIVLATHRVVEEARQTIQLRTDVMLNHYGSMQMSEFFREHPDALAAFIRHWKPPTEPGNNRPKADSPAQPAPSKR